MLTWAAQILPILFRSSVFLSIAALIALLLIRFLRVRSPRVQRLLWLAVVLQGIVWLRFDVTLPSAWLPASPSATHADASESGIVPNVAATSMHEAFHHLKNPEPITINDDRPASPFAIRDAGGSDSTLMIAAAVVWLTGIVLIAGWQVFCYARFLRRLKPCGPPKPEWIAEWNTVQAAAKCRSLIAIRVTDDVGPLLCMRASGYELLLPLQRWEQLTERQRLAILRHELAHLERGDLWKSAVIRLLALVHWFNPFTWMAVRRFEDAAEIACDEMIRKSIPDAVTQYARALLQLGGGASVTPSLPAANGRNLVRRIQRLLEPSVMENSGMKMTVLMCAMGTIAAFNVMQVSRSDDEAKPSQQSVPAAQGLRFDTVTVTDDGDLTLDAAATVRTFSGDNVIRIENARDPFGGTLVPGSVLLLDQVSSTSTITTGPGNEAFIDMAHLFRYSPQFIRLQAELKEKIVSADADAKERVAVIQQMEKSLKAKSEESESAEYAALVEARDALKLKFAEYLLKSRAEMKNSESQVFLSVYRTVYAEVAAYAKEEGISTVRRINRSSIGDPQELDPKDPQSVIKLLNREIVFAEDSRRDITDIILERLKEKDQAEFGTEAKDEDRGDESTDPEPDA